MARRELNEAVLERAAALCRARGVLVPTLAQQRAPETAPETVRGRLSQVEPSAVDPLNLFRVTWRNDVATGLFGPVNTFEVPRELTGARARVIGLVGCRFPTGAPTVGAAFGCLVPRLAAGLFDPTAQRAVWPSTGASALGGAFVCAVLGAKAVAVVPESLGQERFEALRGLGAEVIATPGSERRVKALFDTCRTLSRTQPQGVVFNPYAELGNAVWHHHVTGPALLDAYRAAAAPGARLAAFVAATGSAGTLGAGDFLKRELPGVLLAAAEALQCPTLLENGVGEHRIEGVGDQHVPWIHNVRNTDAVVGVDDDVVLRLLRLFNEPVGQALLRVEGIADEARSGLRLLGPSSACNLLAALEVARAFELGDDDVVMTVFADSADAHQSLLDELCATRGPYSERQAAVDLDRLGRLGAARLRELGHRERKALHQLKHFTWVEQQGKSADELRALWAPDFWEATYGEALEWDALIDAFNARTGVLRALGG